MSKQRELLTPQEIEGAWAIIPTPSKEGADDYRMQDTVDLDESARVVEAMIAAGVDGLLCLGTLGECGSLEWEEKRAFMGVIADTARGRIPVFGGSTTLSTRSTIRETAAAVDLGMDGVMVGPSMWNKPDVATAIQFYKELAEAVPDAAICIYANPFVFKFDFPAPFWAEVAKLRQVVSAKVASYANLLRDLSVTTGGIRFMPIDFDYYGAARLAPEATQAFWSSGASCGPAPIIALRDAVEAARVSGDWSQAEKISGELANATAPIVAYGDMNLFQSFNITLERGRMEAAGWMKVGPNRPPYHRAPPLITDYARQGGEMWRALQTKYQAGASVHDREFEVRQT